MCKAINSENVKLSKWSLQRYLDDLQMGLKQEKLELPETQVFQYPGNMQETS